MMQIEKKTESPLSFKLSLNEEKKHFPKFLAGNRKIFMNSENAESIHGSLTY